jgi:hypothetical protein
MFGTSPNLLIELRSQIKQLGSEGGLVSPSVYDTAQVLRLYPPAVGVGPGIEWLLTQQHADGGWGVPTVPSARDVPTLAAILTLHVYRHRFAVTHVIEAGLDFLKGQAYQWQSLHIDLIPIAGEMILPYLLEEAARMGMVIDQAPYARLFELRRRKLIYLDGRSLPCNSAPTYSWEALGFSHQSAVLHPRTGVGHSPAATAAWLHTAQEVGEDNALCTQAEAYLARAAATTGIGIPGVMPMVHPITGFEYSYGLYALLLTGLLDHPALQDVVAPLIAKLRDMVKQEQGLSFGAQFVADVDDTAVAVVVLQAAQQSPDLQLVRRFWRDDHFYTYDHELNPSVFSNAHALHALVLCHERSEVTENFLIRKQTEGGAWGADKWHTSWQSTTMEVVAALVQLGYEDELHQAGQALINDQNFDGSWGQPTGARMLETTYSIIALQLLTSNPRLAEAVQPALKRGWQWLWEHRDNIFTVESSWLGKEVYSAVRVDNIYKLCALLSPILNKTQPLSGQSVETRALMHAIYEAS